MRNLILILLLIPFLMGAAGSSTIFDGTNDKVSYGDIPAIDDATSLSCSVWSYNNNLTQDHHLFGSRTSSAGIILLADDVGSTGGRTDAYTIFIQDSDGTNAGVWGATNSSKQATWQPVGFSFLANNLTGLHLYIDSIEDANGPTTTVNVAQAGSTNASISSGTTPGDAVDRNGNIGYLQCWSRILSLAELINSTWLPGSVSGSMQLFDTMMDGSNTHIDLSGNARTGTPANQATGSALGPPVMFGSGLPL